MNGQRLLVLLALLSVLFLMGNAPAPYYACQGKAVSDACSYGYGSTCSSNAGVCTLSGFIHRRPADHRSQRATHLREPVKMRARPPPPMVHLIALLTTLTIEGLGMAAAALLLPGWRPRWRLAPVLLAFGLNLVSHTPSGWEIGVRAAVLMPRRCRWRSWWSWWWKAPSTPRR